MSAICSNTSNENKGYNLSIFDVLENYRSSARNSLNGPTDSIVFNSSNHVYSKVPSIPSDSSTNYKTINSKRTQFSQPILLTSDTNSGILSETNLNGTSMSCFMKGGEERLLLPQVFTLALHGFGLSMIHMACDRLQIYCPTCAEDQLQLLKRLFILPPTATQCGLITRTDVERLCSELLNYGEQCPADLILPSSLSLPPHPSAPTLSNHSDPVDAKSSDLRECLQRSVDSNVVPVVHRCFGKNLGYFYYQLYAHPRSSCILCVTCRCLFSPTDFTLHSHSRNKEIHTVHWGFSSARWRHYLRLPFKQVSVEGRGTRLDESAGAVNSSDLCASINLLQQIKSKFDEKAELSSDDEMLYKRIRSSSTDHLLTCYDTADDGFKCLPPQPHTCTELQQVSHSKVSANTKRFGSPDGAHISYTEEDTKPILDSYFVSRPQDFSLASRLHKHVQTTSQLRLDLSHTYKRLHKVLSQLADAEDRRWLVDLLLEAGCIDDINISQLSNSPVSDTNSTEMINQQTQTDNI